VNQKNDALFALTYFFAYLGYLFLHQESEFLHWLTLLGLPLFLITCLAKRRVPATTFREVLNTVGVSRENWAGDLVWAILLGVVLSALQLVLSRNRGEILHVLFTPRALYLVPASFLMMIGLAGFTEEFFFRGVLQTRLSKLLNSNFWAVITASFFFGLYHLPYAYLNPRWPSHGNWTDAASAAFGQGVPIGLILGTVYVKSRQNLLACAVLHSLINTLPAMLLLAGK
jgi:membrane protease YdiL (CAAX protease family)